MHLCFRFASLFANSCRQTKNSAHFPISLVGVGESRIKCMTIRWALIAFGIVSRTNCIHIYIRWTDVCAKMHVFRDYCKPFDTIGVYANRCAAVRARGCNECGWCRWFFFSILIFHPAEWFVLNGFVLFVLVEYLVIQESNCRITCVGVGFGCVFF